MGTKALWDRRGNMGKAKVKMVASWAEQSRKSTSLVVVGWQLH